MEKKRREKNSGKILNSRLVEAISKLEISKEVSRSKNDGIECVEYHILPKFGRGLIFEICFKGVVITISKFILEKEVVLFCESRVGDVELSFLMEGEKTIRNNKALEEIPYVSQESYIAEISEDFSYNRIFCIKPFKEIKITLCETFFEKYEVAKEIIFKNKGDTNLIIPISNDLLTILASFESEKIKGFSQKMFLQAKILEITAIQIDNYKKNNFNDLTVERKKNLKKVYLLKQFLKDNLHKNFSIKELSLQIGINENLLKSEFKRVFEYSINKYFTLEKMKKAKYLLQNTELPIYEIAEDVGYKNATHFSAAFKRFYKETPKACRLSIEN